MDSNKEVPPAAGLLSQDEFNSKSKQNKKAIVSTGARNEGIADS
jgi:hypothetical protein